MAEILTQPGTTKIVLKAGTLLHVNGIPVKLLADAEVEAHPKNVDMVAEGATTADLPGDILGI